MRTNFHWFMIGVMAVNAIGLCVLLLHAELFLTTLILYYLDFVIVPVVVLVLLLLQRKASGKRIKRPWLLMVMSFLLLGTYIYATHIEPHQLQVRTFTYSHPKVQHPITIVHLTDIQSNSVSEYEAQALREVGQYNPDMIIHTGDLVQTNGSSSDQIAELQKLARLLKETLPSNIPKYNVLGDTDEAEELHSASFDEISGFKTLKDESEHLNIGNNAVTISGFLLASSRSSDKNDVLHLIRDRKMDAIHILAGHAPDYTLHLEGNEDVLCLAGHTHGGQVRLPGIGPIITLTQVPRDWARGTTAIGNCYLNVSAGIGAEHAAGLPSIRFNCPPEFTVITILPEESTE